jgi:hypothetical protein
MKRKTFIIAFAVWVLFFAARQAPSTPPNDDVEAKTVLLKMAEKHPAADSITAHIQEMNDQAVCTLKGLREMFEAHIWRTPETPFEARIEAWNNHIDFKKWMGKLDPVKGELIMSRFRDQLDDMIERLSGGEITYSVKSAWINYCKFSPSNAFVRSGSKSRTIFLCPKWFEQPEREQVATLIHELVHTFGFSHPKETDTPLEALALAKASPSLAIQSPENFESLVELYVCR